MNNRYAPFDDYGPPTDHPLDPRNDYGSDGEEDECEHKWKVTQEGVTYCDLRCTKCGETKRETWD